MIGQRIKKICLKNGTIVERIRRGSFAENKIDQEKEL